jgi:energy-converting hydrogenase A subunit R
VAGRAYITDCEGPVSKNDNAYEIAEAFLEDGGRFFTLLSKFDDYLGDIEKVPGYRYGSTLKYVLPFLKAAGLTDREAARFSAGHVTIMNGVKDAFDRIAKAMPISMVSTSYVHYVEAVCRCLNLSMDSVYCTRLSFDGYHMGDEEKKAVMDYFQRFLDLPPIAWDDAGSLGEPSARAVRVLKDFFFSILPSMPVRRWVDPVLPIGGEGKEQAVTSIAAKGAISMEDVMYVGDSITDAAALELVRREGGLSVSFNGNRYAVMSAEYSVVALDASVLATIAEAFRAHGKGRIRTGDYGDGARVFRRGSSDPAAVTALSERIRKEVRGQAIGELG